MALRNDNNMIAKAKTTQGTCFPPFIIIKQWKQYHKKKKKRKRYLTALAG